MSIEFKTRFRPLIRVFVSSTFSDLKHERNALQAKVWPELERYCQQRGFQFQAIDLRWGVPTEAGLDHRTMRICFEELHRSQEMSPKPNFLILLGNRYGWRPLPEAISDEEFEKLKTAALQIQAEPPDLTRKPTPSQVECMKKAVAVLEDWYLLDENAKPFGDKTLRGEYVLRTRKTLLRNVDYGKRPDADGKLRDTVAWVDVQFVLWSIVNRAFPAKNLSGRFQTQHEASVPTSVRFQASATEQEIWQGALQVENADQHVIAAVREVANLDEFPNQPRRGAFIDLNDDGTPDDDARQALTDLKAELERRLSRSPIIRSTCHWAIDQYNSPTGDITTTHLDQLCNDILKRIMEIIKEQINTYWGCDLSADDASLGLVRGSRQELDLERADHLRFAAERAPKQLFVGRDSELQCIRDYLYNENNKPFVVYGPSGRGKTALLGKILQEVTPLRSANGTRAKTGPIVLTRFIGTTPESSNLRSLLSSLCRELRQEFEMPSPLPTDLNELIDEFYSQLGKATTTRPIFMFLDALDQLDTADHSQSVSWIRSPLPSTTDASCCVRMVVSCLSPSDEFPEDSEACGPFRELKLRKLLSQVELGALDEKEARKLIARWLRAAGRSLTTNQQRSISRTIKGSPACCQPLFLKLLFEEAKLWRSFDTNVPLNALVTSNDCVGALLTQLFNRLSLDVNHGQLLVERALGYIVSARRGLSETEILEILFADPDYKKSLDKATLDNNHSLPSEPPRIPIAIWSRLRSDLAPYLTERAAPGGNVLTLYHRQVAEWVKVRFVNQAKMPKSIGAASEGNLHGRLGEFFSRQDSFLKSLKDHRISARLLPSRTANIRKADELIWQLIAAENYTAAEDLLGSLEFLQCKAEADLVFDLAFDFECLKATGHSLSIRLSHLAELVSQESQVLHKWPQITSQHIHNACVFRGQQSYETDARRLIESVGLMPLLAIEAKRIGSEAFITRWLGRHERAVHCVAVCPETRCCISGGYDRTLWVFPILETPVSIPIGFMIEAVEFASSYPHAVVAGRDGQMVLVDLQSRDIQPLGNVAGRVHQMKVDRSGVVAYVLHGNGSLSCLDLNSRSVNLCHTVSDGGYRVVVVGKTEIYEVPAPAQVRPQFMQIPTTSPFVSTSEGKILQLVNGKLESTTLSHPVGSNRVDGDPSGGFLGVLGTDQVLNVYSRLPSNSWRVVHRAVDVGCFAWGPDGSLTIGRLNGDVEVHEARSRDLNKLVVASDGDALRIRAAPSVPKTRVRVQLKEVGLFALVDVYANAHALDQRARLAVAVPRYDAILWIDDSRRLWWSHWQEIEAKMSAPKKLGSTDGEVVHLADLPLSCMGLLGYADGQIRVVHYNLAGSIVEHHDLADLAGHSSAVIRAVEMSCEPLVAVLFHRMILLFQPTAIEHPSVPCGLLPLPAIATALAWDTDKGHERTLLVGDEQSWWMRVAVGTQRKN